MNDKIYYLLTYNEDWADEHNVPALACMTEEEFESWKEEDTVNERGTDDESYRICARLGNSGDGFGESFDYASKMKDLLKDKTVKVTEVDESFYKVFKKAGLADLSLCTIFNLED